MSQKGKMPAVVSTYETELDMMVNKSSVAKGLFDAVNASTGIRETWYFGLNYTDTYDQDAWLRAEKKVTQQGVKPNENGKLKFRYKFKFFPENVADEVIQDVTLRLLFKQVKHEVLNESIYCPAEKAVLLSSFAVQAKLGDYDSDSHATGYLANEKILPPKVLSQHKLSIEEWEEKVSQFHKQHRGMSREEAMLEYLKIAQDLEMYGITYFTVLNAKGSEVLLGIDSLGINFYDVKDKFSPKVSFPWSEIAKVSYTKEKFTIRFTDKSTPPHKVKGKHPKTCKKIFFLATGNHEMYKRRRMPDPLDVQQMKAERDNDREAREKQKVALRKEIAAREKMEKMQEEMEAKFKELQDEMDLRKKELEESRENIERLERQLAETQAAREELERQQAELKEMLEKMQSEKDMEHEEKMRLEEEIRAKQEEIEKVREAVEAKEDETRLIQEEMEDAKRKLEVTSVAMQQSSVTMTEMRESDSSSSSDEEEENNNVPKIVVDNALDEDREPDARTENLLKDLRDDLSETVHEDAITEEDRQYLANLAQGRDKFKTLREVRRGNTKRRIDTFENM